MDTQVLELLWSWRQPWLDRGFAALTWLGSILVLLPLALLLAVRTKGTARWFPVAALAGGALLAHAGKLLFALPRPDLFPPLVAMPSDGSFPSAHTLQVTALVAGWLLRPGAAPPGGAAIASGILLVLAVGVSRLYLQVHWPSDVVAGAAAGLAWVLLLRRLRMWEKAA